MRRFAMAALVAGSITACGGVSTQQEVQLGTDYASQINAELPIVQDFSARLIQRVQLPATARSLTRFERQTRSYAGTSATGIAHLRYLNVSAPRSIVSLVIRSLAIHA